MKIQDKQAQKVGFKKDSNGFLRATVNLGRLGSMQYLGKEIPDAGDNINPNDIYDVHTTADQLFADSTVKSFEGVPLTIQHPDSMQVDASNWKEVTVGHVENVRPSNDYLVGDVVVNDADAIKKVESGLREVSLGYDADLSQKDGIISKVNIVGNHLAIVDEGRCGAECKINDKKGGIMSALEKLRKKFGVSKTQPKKNKMGDAKVKILAQKKKLNDANVAFAQSLKDAEAVLASTDSTDEQKLEAVQQLQEQATSLQEEAQQALSDATDATEQAQQLAEQVTPATDDTSTTNDDDVVSQAADEATQKIEDLQNQLSEANDKIADLESQLAQVKDAQDASTTANDCKRVFPNLKFKDSATSKDMKRQVLVSVGAYTDASAKTLTDCALDSAYHSVIATASTKAVKANNIGKKIADNAGAKPKVTARQRLGGK